MSHLLHLTSGIRKGVSVWRVRGLVAVVGYMRGRLWKRSVSCLYRRPASQSPRQGAADGTYRIVRIQKGQSELPIADIERMGADGDIENFEQGAIGYLAYEGFQLVGIGWRFRHSYLLDRLGWSSRCVYLGGFYVIESARGKGVFPALLAAMGKDVVQQGFDCVSETALSNLSSQRGLEKAGFEKAGILTVVMLLGLIIRYRIKKD